MAFHGDPIRKTYVAVCPEESLIDGIGCLSRRDTRVESVYQKGFALHGSECTAGSALHKFRAQVCYLRLSMVER